MVKDSVTGAPAPWFVSALGSVAALIVAFGHLSTAGSASVFSIATAAGVIVSAFLMRPVAVPVIAGAAGVILGDLSIVGFHLSPDQTGAMVGAITLVLGAFLHVIHVQTSDSGSVPVAPPALR